jgi:hypothetical protein
MLVTWESIYLNQDKERVARFVGSMIAR